MGHTYSNILTHVIFGTKGRRPVIGEPVRGRLYQYLSGVARREFGRALHIGGTADHVHGLLLIRPDVSVAEAMRKWKALSSRWVHRTFPEAADFAWQEGYGAFSVSESLKAEVGRYVARQAEHHRKLTFEEEFVRFLDRHGVEHDPRYVWPAGR